MLLCNNTAIYRDSRHQSRGARRESWPVAGAAAYIAAMTDADELARRYLSLWTEYLTALLGDPRALEMLKRWQALTGQFSYPDAGSSLAGGAPFSAWPPFFAPFGPPVPPAADAGAAQADALAALAERVDQLDRRLAAIERKIGQPRTRRTARDGTK